MAKIEALGYYGNGRPFLPLGCPCVTFDSYLACG